jgi:hypothetical protein
VRCSHPRGVPPGALLLAAPSTAAAETRRLAVVVGNNAGTGELPPLRFAEADAGKVAGGAHRAGQVPPMTSTCCRAARSAISSRRSRC